MRKTIHKWFWVWDFDKEEKWLNEMAAKGLSLIAVKFVTYEFEDTLPGEYQIRLQYLENHMHCVEKEKYIGFLEETGVQHVGNFGRWVYLRKKATDGRFEIFSDNASRVKQLTNIIILLGILLGANLSSGAYNLLLYLQWSNPVSLGFILNLLIIILLSYGIIKLLKKRKKIKNERQIFE